MATALREASGNLGAPYATGERVEAILYQARADAGRFLNCSADDVIFGGNMTTLDFALSRTASRDWREGDKILVSRLDHDGGVAPWVELAADRGFELDWIDVTDDLRLDLDDLERKLDDRVRVVAFVFASNAVGSITDAKRVAELARERRRALVGRRGALRGARADRRRGHRLRRAALLAVQVLRAAHGPGLRPARAARVLAPLQGAPRVDEPRRPPLRDRNAAVRAARRLLGDDRVPRLARRPRAAPGLRARARPPVPRRAVRQRHRLRPTDDGGSRPDVPAQRRRRRGGRGRDDDGAARLRRVGPRQLVLARPAREAAVSADAVRVGFIHYNTAAEVDGFLAELASLG